MHVLLHATNTTKHSENNVICATLKLINCPVRDAKQRSKNKQKNAWLTVDVNAALGLVDGLQVAVSCLFTTQDTVNFFFFYFNEMSQSDIKLKG